MSFIADGDEFCFVWVSVSVCSWTSKTGQRPDVLVKLFSAVVESLDPEDTYSWLSSEQRWCELRIQKSCDFRGVVQRVNSSGPRTDPWGTPKVRWTLEDRRSPSFILRHLPVRHDLVQSSAKPRDKVPCLKAQAGKRTHFFRVTVRRSSH